MQPQIRSCFRHFENSKQSHPWGYEICFVWECCADGVNKNLMKFSQLMRFHRRNIHKQNKSRNLSDILHRKILSVPVFLKSQGICSSRLAIALKAVWDTAMTIMRSEWRYCFNFYQQINSLFGIFVKQTVIFGVDICNSE